ncbi:hypothetical protein MauCBS54593_005959 [Microsporum audouinii]
MSRERILTNNVPMQGNGPGGSLVLSFVSQTSTGEQNYQGPVDACRAALMDIVRESLIPLEVVGEFNVPTYNRTLEDVYESLNEMNGDCMTIGVYEKKALHPAVERLVARNQAHPQCIDSHQVDYADTVIDL